MKISVKELREKSDFMMWLILRCITSMDKDIHDIWPELPPKDGLWDIKFTMNGVELPVIEAFEDLANMRDEEIKEEAMKLISDKFWELEETLQELSENAKRKFAEELGVKLEEK